MPNKAKKPSKGKKTPAKRSRKAKTAPALFSPEPPRRSFWDRTLDWIG
jgi:hypothetical protein